MTHLVGLLPAYALAVPTPASSLRPAMTRPATACATTSRQARLRHVRRPHQRRQHRHKYTCSVRCRRRAAPEPDADFLSMNFAGAAIMQMLTKTLIRLLIAILAAGASTTAVAQNSPLPTDRFSVSPGGVDLKSGAFVVDKSELVIGDPAHGGLEFKRTTKNQFVGKRSTCSVFAQLVYFRTTKSQRHWFGKLPSLNRLGRAVSSVFRVQ